MTITSRARHFNHKHPLFRKQSTDKGVKWSNSIYYLWFEYLRRNEKYKTYCETKRGSKEIKNLYADFGDIYSVDFKQWWRTIGQDLFCEQADLERIEVIHSENDLDTKSDNILNLAVPINKNFEWLQKQYTKILRDTRNKKGVGKKGVPKSTAKYPIEIKNPNIESLQKALLIYDTFKAKQDANFSIVQVAYATRIWAGQTQKSTASIRQQTYRLKKTAEEIIANVAKKQKRRDGKIALGVFPKHEVRR